MSVSPKRKSIFDQFGFKKTIDELVNYTADLYVADSIPWIVGYSGGKDSSAILQIMWRVLEKLKKDGRPVKPLYVMTTDTLVENPIVSIWVKNSLKLLKEKSLEKGLTVHPNLLTPAIDDTFWVSLIGKGYPAPRRTFRWCTSRLKIKSSENFIQNIANQHGEVILVLGTRKAESSDRNIQITKREKLATRKDFQTHGENKNVSTFLPIKDWSNDDVWLYLLQDGSPWGINNKDLLSMYQGATEGGECPLVVDSSTPSCGDSRFGCWTCTLVKKDRSMAAMVQNDDEKSWMEPLLQFRNMLDERNDDERDFRRLSGNVQLFKEDDTKSVPGPYTQKSREHWLRMLLQAQEKVLNNPKLPEKLKDFQAISQDELDQIRKIWFYEKLETEDLVPKICEEEAKGRYQFESLEDNHLFDQNIMKILKEECGNDDLTFELARGLLEVERKYFKSNRRHGLHDEFEKVFKKSFFEGKEDALSYAREKKSYSENKFNQSAAPNIEAIKDLNGELELPELKAEE